MKVEFDIASDQIDGARDYQEDAYMVNQLGEADNGDICSLVVMADGMGGHAAGNVASNMVVATFYKTFQAKFPTTEIGDALTDALNRSNDQIHASVKETPALRGMGCTMVSAYVQDCYLYWISVGDSHLYLIRDRELIKQNADHSYGAYLDMMKEQGMAVDEQAGMSRNMLMSAMTGVEVSSIDVTEHPIELRPGDRVIVASDGLDTLGSGEIIQYSSWSSTAKECVYALLKAVEDANKINQDNTTLIVIDIKEREARPEPPPPEAAPKPAESRPQEDEAKVPNEYKEPRSYRWLIWLFVIALLIGGGLFARQLGWVDKAVSKGNELVETALQSIDAAREAMLPEPEPEPEPVVEPVVVAEPEPALAAKGVVLRNRLKSGGNGPAMIKVPAGSYRMGATSAAVAPDAVPRHEVKISSFMVSVYEITFAEYYRFAGATGRKKPENSGWDIKQHPVLDVSWGDALAYTRWLSKETGKRYRLLSEAEWEYVARAGTTTPFWWGTKAGAENAHCFDCQSDFSISKPAKVGSYKANAFGVYDTAGNVFEWVHDCYHPNYQDAPTDGSVWEGGNCDYRVVRGGSFGSPASSLRAEKRNKFNSDKGQYNTGIRVARDL